MSGNLWHTVLTIVIPVIIGLYEVIVRVIPTVGNISLIGKIIDFLKWVSDHLNNTKKLA
jgi:hypothetical protein